MIMGWKMDKTLITMILIFALVGSTLLYFLDKSVKNNLNNEEIKIEVSVNGEEVNDLIVNDISKPEINLDEFKASK